MSLIIFILLLVALIVVHEFGHFGVAKLFGIKVEEFGIGFPPRIAGIQIGETLYSINILFFGGFVRIFGETKGEGEHDARSFARKSKWIQAAVVSAGIFCNLIFAWLILSTGYMVGLPTSSEHIGIGTVQDAKATIVGIIPNSPAEKSKMNAGDSIVSITTGANVVDDPKTAQEAQDFIQAHQDESLVIKTQSEKGTQSNFVVKAESGLIAGKKAVGIQLDDVGILRLSPPLALYEGALLTWNMTQSTATGLVTFFAQIFRGTADFSSVAGPIGIASIGSQAVSNGFSAAVSLVALISINLALINILPIPGLDGGRVLIIVLEGLTKRRMSDKWLLWLSMAGFGALILLMLVVSYHDILRLIG